MDTSEESPEGIAACGISTVFVLTSTLCVFEYLGRGNNYSGLVSLLPSLLLMQISAFKITKSWMQNTYKIWHLFHTDNKRMLSECFTDNVLHNDNFSERRLGSRKSNYSSSQESRRLGLTSYARYIYFSACLLWFFLSIVFSGGYHTDLN